ncbi:sensor histidine kinase [Paenibacillus pasadenensis]|uniref:histidine kinase n=1 Tax=Paenibacillus pasadenensis TaxID=217090 RepID=A0A2N5N1A8_9BACL|nr:HAMP domain-containing sensor histidine kinase [Paenibacillus pasadenensis]PLT44119.1 sensor histidine kinase [Paenibacillus pasadenensis]
MMTRMLQTFLWKLLLRFALSLAAMAALVWLGYFLSELLLRYNPSRSFPITRLLVAAINGIGSLPIMLAAGTALFLGLFFWMSRRFLQRFDAITDGLQQIAGGDLAHRIEDDSADELGAVSRSVNEMARRLAIAQQEERSAAQAKNDLITGVSHDLRTPLTSILGFLEYIQKDRYRDELELRQYVDIAYDKALVLRKLIDDLFEYTRVAGGSMPLQAEPVDLNPFLRQLADEYEPLLEEAGMACRVHPSGQPLLVQADPELLLRVFENLLTNAIRYGASGGAVDIYVRPAAGSASPDEEEADAAADQAAMPNETAALMAEVVFRNYGEPIPPSHLPRLFDRFYRVDASRSRQTGGSGLGLAIVKSIVDLHGGVIEAASSKRRTEFIVRLPL